MQNQRLQNQTLAARLWLDQAGFIMSAEAVLVATIAVIGVIVGLVSTRDSVVSELSDVGGAFQAMNQTFSFTGISTDLVTVFGSRFTDSRDFCDEPGDPSGQADNCISFELGPSNEGDPAPDPWEPPPTKTVELSDVSSFSGTGSTNNSATGTIGDGSVDTNFQISTTGDIIGFVNNKVRFREGEVNAGTYTIDFDDPLTNLEFFVGNFTNTQDDHNNLLGNFKVELSDGTVLNNANFTILPDAITGGGTFGEFTTWGSTNELLTQVSQGGASWVTDPTVNGSGNQGGGRLVFTDVPPYVEGGVDCVGITQIMFDMTGGPNGFSAVFGVSGQVMDITP